MWRWLLKGEAEVLSATKHSVSPISQAVLQKYYRIRASARNFTLFFHFIKCSCPQASPALV